MVVLGVNGLMVDDDREWGQEVVDAAAMARVYGEDGGFERW